MFLTPCKESFLTAWTVVRNSKKHHFYTVVKNQYKTHDFLQRVKNVPARDLLHGVKTYGKKCYLLQRVRNLPRTLLPYISESTGIRMPFWDRSEPH